MSKPLDYLDELEAEAIYILREVAGQFDKPALLFSGGKDSICLVHLALKAFRPGKFPFPLVHIDTGHNFQETIIYRDNLVKNIEEKLIVRYVADTIKAKQLQDAKGKFPSRNALQTYTLLDVIEEFEFDACVGGARRDEEKARAKERFFSHRDEFGQWDPKNQRPELWMLLNGRKHQGEHFRVFPLSNWTEMDVWMYIAMEKIDIPNIYFTHQREIVMRDGMLLANSEYISVRENEKAEMMTVRFRTIGDMTCTGAVLSPANSLQQIIEEVAASKTTERGTRSDDKRSETAMEDRKKAGYF